MSNSSMFGISYLWLRKVGTRSVRETYVVLLSVSKPKRPCQRQDKTNRSKHTELKRGVGVGKAIIISTI